MQVAALLAGVASAIALAGSVVFFARQSREAARQTRLANQTAGLQAMAQAIGQIDSATAYFMEYPELRQYFYEGVMLSATAAKSDPHLRVRVLVLAELLADALETSLDAVRTVEAVGENTAEMEDYVRFLLHSSPTLCSLIQEHPWWPDLALVHESVAARTIPAPIGAAAQ